MSVNISDTLTPEGKRFMKELQELAKLEAQIGIHRGDNVDENGTDYADIAAWNEFGTTHIPSRPFLKQSVDNNIDEINQLLMELKQMFMNGTSAKQILKEIGETQKALIKVEITDGSFEPNAKSTVKKKGSDKPLIDTGQLLQSVNYKIKPKGT